MSEISSKSAVLSSGVEELRDQLVTEKKKLHAVQSIASALSSSLDLDELLVLIMEKSCQILGADRATLFLMSENRKELWSKISKGGNDLEIRLQVGEGIAGWVAHSGEVVNIFDAYSDDRFQPAFDMESGYRTRSILCVPMRNTRGDITGVLQLLNKYDGCFNHEDIELLSTLAGQAAVSIESAKLYTSVVANNVALIQAQDKLQERSHELDVLYEIEREIASAVDLDSLLYSLLNRAIQVVGSEAGCIALVEGNGKEKVLRFQSTVGEAVQAFRHQTIGLSDSLIGWATLNTKAIIANDPTADPRFNVSFSTSFGVHTKSLICAPLVETGQTLGVIALQDKAGGEPYDEEDLRMLQLISGQASRAIHLHRSKKELADKERLAGVGQMVAGVLHDLRTPMTIVSGYAQLMADCEVQEEREEYVEKILLQFDLLSGMTKEVLAFAKGESTVLIRKVFLSQYMQQVEEQLKIAFKESNIRLLVKAEYRGAAFFDQQSILRLVHNLARNAAAAMRGKSGLFQVVVHVEGNALCFDFIDNGPGIPSSLEGKLFELFSTSSQGGTGLGLALCKKIVEEHEGTISYTSAAGEGTTFFVRLPLSPGHKQLV